MRRPFLFLLLLISLYCWLKDCVNFFFYILKSKSNTDTSSTIIGLVLFLALLYGLKVTLSKKIALPSLNEVFQTHRKKEWLLLLFVCLPVIILGLFRSIFPDQNFDTVHYELYLQEFDYAQNKSSFAPGSSATFIFHLSEKIAGLFRHLLGYRVGEMLNTFLLVTILVSCYDFIKRFLSEYGPSVKTGIILAALSALYVISAQNTMFLIGSYKTDLIGVPLLLELIYLIFWGSRYSVKVNYVIFFILASLTVALKLTYLPFVGILAVIYLVKNLKRLSPVLLFSIPFVIFLFPAPFLLYSFRETGNPLFPFFNTIFHSPLFPDIDFRDTRWGPKSLPETLFFHIVLFDDPARINEWKLYSYRLLFGFFISLGLIIFYLLGFKKNKYNKYLKQLAFLGIVALLFDYSWIVTSGNPRYGTIAEVLYGLVIALLLLQTKEKLASVFLMFAIFFQASDTFRTIYYTHENLSWWDYRALFANKELRENNVHMMLHDHGSIADSNNVLPKVDAFLTLSPCVNDGIARLVKKNVPVYDLSGARTKDSIDSFEKNVVRVESQNKNLIAIGVGTCLMTFEWITNLNKKGFLATDVNEIYPDFLRANEPLFLFNVKYYDTSKYTIHTIEKLIVLDNPQIPDTVFNYHSDRKVKAFVRESPFTYEYPLSIYDLYINNKKYTINSKAKVNKMLTIDTNSFSIRASEPKQCIVIIQEMELKSP